MVGTGERVRGWLRSFLLGKRGRVSGRWRLQRRAAQQVAEADVLIEDLTVAGHGFGVSLIVGYGANPHAA